MMSGDPADIGEALALPIVQGTVQSPRVMGGLNYGAGWTAGKVGQSAPAKAAGVLTSAPGSAASTNLSRTERDLPTIAPAVARASGGGVKKPTHEQLLARLMNMVERAKKAEKNRTKPMLSVPDEIVANALAAAQRAI
jgi:hypothetical protein